MAEETITISREEYDRLQRNERLYLDEIRTKAVVALESTKIHSRDPLDQGELQRARDYLQTYELWRDVLQEGGRDTSEMDEKYREYSSRLESFAQSQPKEKPEPPCSPGREPLFLVEKLLEKKQGKRGGMMRPLEKRPLYGPGPPRFR